MFVGIDNDVVLVDVFYCVVLFFFVNVDVEGFGLERYFGKIFDFGCLCGGEEYSLVFIFGENFDNLVYFIFEINFENMVGFVDN